MCGDFNFTRSQNERRGRGWSSKLMLMFSNLINKLEMVDLPMGNQQYAWSNMQSNPTLAKLDSFLISTEWDQVFSLSNVTALPQITSDHSPLLLVTQRKKVIRLFRFEKVWLTREDFNKLVPVWWNKTSSRSSSVLTFAAKLHHCRKRSKEWCATNFYNILNTKRALSENLQKLDLLEERQNLR